MPVALVPTDRMKTKAWIGPKKCSTWIQRLSTRHPSGAEIVESLVGVMLFGDVFFPRVTHGTRIVVDFCSIR